MCTPRSLHSRTKAVRDNDLNDAPVRIFHSINKVFMPCRYGGETSCRYSINSETLDRERAIDFCWVRAVAIGVQSDASMNVYGNVYESAKPVVGYA